MKCRRMSWLWMMFGIVASVVVVIVVLGSTQPATHVASARARFARSPADVFAAISDHAAQKSWRSDLKAFEMLPPQDGKTVFRETTGFGAITYIVEESQPPRRYVTRILDETLPYGGSWTFELVPDGAGTQLTITEAGEVKAFLFRALSTFFSKTATIEKYLKELGTQLGETVVPEVPSKG